MFFLTSRAFVSSDTRSDKHEQTFGASPSAKFSSVTFNTQQTWGAKVFYN